jgi:hypothetical protein
MIVKIRLDLIDDFNNHPFKVVEDESLKELAGVLSKITNLITKQKKDG